MLSIGDICFPCNILLLLSLWKISDIGLETCYCLASRTGSSKWARRLPWLPPQRSERACLSLASARAQAARRGGRRSRADVSARLEGTIKEHTSAKRVNTRRLHLLSSAALLWKIKIARIKDNEGDERPCVETRSVNAACDSATEQARTRALTYAAKNKRRIKGGYEMTAVSSCCHWAPLSGGDICQMSECVSRRVDQAQTLDFLLV